MSARLPRAPAPLAGRRILLAGPLTPAGEALSRALMVAGAELALATADLDAAERLATAAVGSDTEVQVIPDPGAGARAKGAALGLAASLGGPCDAVILWIDAMRDAQRDLVDADEVNPLGGDDAAFERALADGLRGALGTPFEWLRALWSREEEELPTRLLFWWPLAAAEGASDPLVAALIDAGLGLARSLVAEVGADPRAEVGVHAVRVAPGGEAAAASYAVWALGPGGVGPPALPVTFGESGGGARP